MHKEHIYPGQNLGFQIQFIPWCYIANFSFLINLLCKAYNNAILQTIEQNYLKAETQMYKLYFVLK